MAQTNLRLMEQAEKQRHNQALAIENDRNEMKNHIKAFNENEWR